MSAEPIPVDLATEALDAMREAWVAERRTQRYERSGPLDYVYLSGIRDCTRRMALDLTNPEDAPPFSDDALDRMERGKDREADVLAFLARCSRRSRIRFEVCETQLRLEIHDRDGVLLGVGKIDARIRFENGAEFIGDVKASQFNDRIETAEDFERSPWTKHWPDQVLLYAYRRSTDNALLILDRPGTPKFVPIPLLPNLARVEDDLQKMRAAVDFRHGRGPLPEATDDRAECRRCPHAGKSCTANLDGHSGVSILADESLIQLAEVREAHEDAHREYERADKRLKDALRGVERGLLGPYEVTGKWSPSTTYDVPKEIKEQYRKVNPQGRFLLEIERVLS